MQTVLLAQGNNYRKKTSNDKYVCVPCGYDCDKQVLTQRGECSHCKMALVKQSNVVFKSIDSKLICNSLARMKEVVIIDVRSPEEFQGKAQENFGRLKNAINIPLKQLESRLSELQSYKEKPVIVYCSHSHRSPQASYILTQNGFKNVINMSGGMSVLFDEKNNGCIQN